MARFASFLDWKNTVRNWIPLLNGGLDLSNLRHYKWEGSIDAGEVVAITHNLGGRPRTWFVVNSEGVSNTLIKVNNSESGEEWGSKKAYIQNIASTSTWTGSIVFML